MSENSFVAFGDVHLGNHRLMPDTYIEDALLELVEFVQYTRPAIVLFAGDAFDSKVPSMRHVDMFGDALHELGNVSPVFMIPGNHDSMRNGTTIDVFRHIRNVSVITVPRVVEHGNFQIAMIPWMPSTPLATDRIASGGDNRILFEWIFDTFKGQLKPDKFKVLMAHGTYLGVEYHDGVSSMLGQEVMFTSAFFQPYDYSVLGHIHKHQMPTKNVAYTGSICPVSANEAFQPKGILYYDGKDVSFIELSSPKILVVKAEDLPHLKDTEKTVLVIMKEEGDEIDYIPPCIHSEVRMVPNKQGNNVRVKGMTAETTVEDAIAAFLDSIDKGDSKDRVLEKFEAIKRGLE